jgi:hypothetical protein
MRCGGPVAMAPAAAVLALLRRRSTWTRGLLAVSLLLAAGTASARESDEVVRKESPRTGFFELKLGLDYYPSIDQESGVTGSPFATFFGKKERLFPQITYERILWDGFGTLSAGVGAGYSEFYAHAFFSDQPTVRSSEVTSFRVLPLWGMATYRFDWPARELGIPLVPFARAGAGYWLWWSSPESGGRAGWMWSAGGALQLDPFDPRLSREFDADAGVNASYFFVEYTGWTVDGFGSKGFDLSDKVLSLGLALAF